MTKPNFKPQYENYIGGEWVAPADGNYFVNTSPVDGSPIAKMPRSTKADIDLAVAPCGSTARCRSFPLFRRRYSCRVW